MDYNKLVAVAGLPGLYELISSRSDGAVIRSLQDDKVQFAANRKHNFSHLESIEVFTTGENINLVELFQAMEQKSISLPDIKDAGAIKKYFEKVYPEMDFERVYPNDMKKMVTWFEVLKKHGIEIKLTEPEEEVPVEIKEEAPAPPKAKSKKTAPDKEEKSKEPVDKKPASKKK